MPDSTLYGIVAEFDKPDEIVRAAKGMSAEGYHKMEAYTPFQVKELSEVITVRRPLMPLIVLIGGIIGGLTGFTMQYYAAAVSYPLNVAGRPLNSWPAFIPITFEMTVLVAALFGFFGVLIINGLPQPYHPIFNAERFALASQSRFFLCVEANDPKFDPEATRRLLVSLQALSVSDVRE